MKENGLRTAEKYTADGRAERKLTKKDVVFGELGYVNDRFAGYRYRVSESLGYGRTIYDEDALRLQLRAGLGARQSEFTDAQGGGSESEVFLKPALTFFWRALPWLEIGEEFSSAIGSETTITSSKTALKSPITDSLYLKLGFDIEHNSNPPAGVDDTDTFTSLNLGYQF